MLGNNLKQNETGTRKNNLVFLNVNRGKIEHTEPGGRKTYFDYVEGIFSRITKKERFFNGESVYYWYVNFKESEGDRIYSLAFPYSSNVFKSVILALASVPAETLNYPIKIEPWIKGEYTNVTLSINGTRIDWVTKDLPDIRVINIGGRSIKDDSERMNFISNYVNLINDRKSVSIGGGSKFREPQFAGELFPEYSATQTEESKYL